MTGWALFSVRSAKPVRGGVLAPPGADVNLAERLTLLQRDIETLFDEINLGLGDVLICEGPAPLVVNPGSSLKVEQVRGIFEVVARTRGASVPGRLNPRTVQTELLGLKGKQLARKEVKRWAREVAHRLFGNDLERMFDNKSSRNSELHSQRHSKPRDIPQDVIDALLIGALAVSKIQLAERMNVNLSEVLSSSRNSNARWTVRSLARARS